MTDEIIQKLWDYGYFFSPKATALSDVDEEDLELLDLNDLVVIAALREYQDFFKTKLDSLAQTFHRRPAIVDGHIGPATEALFNMPRCGMPDFATVEAEEARFPDACKLKITTSYRMTLSGLSADKLAQLWQRADQNWADVIDVDFSFEPNNYPNTNIHASEAALGGSVLADQYLSNGNCGDRLRGRFDNRTWTEGLFLATCTHEHGHALGYGHSNDSNAIMYPSIHSAGINRGGKPNESDIKAMLGLGYKRRTTTPQPPTTPTTKVITTFSIDGKKYSIVTGDSGSGGWNI